MIYCTICDNQEIDITSNAFKCRVAEAVGELIIRDWNKISNIKKYESSLDNDKKYYAEVMLWDGINDSKFSQGFQSEILVN